MNLKKWTKYKGRVGCPIAVGPVLIRISWTVIYQS